MLGKRSDEMNHVRVEAARNINFAAADKQPGNGLENSYRMCYVKERGDHVRAEAGYMIGISEHADETSRIFGSSRDRCRRLEASLWRISENCLGVAPIRSG